MLGVSQSYVANKIRLLGLSEEIRELIKRSGITERHARALLRLDTEEERRAAAEKMIRMKLTVRQSEALIDSEHPMPPPMQYGNAEKGDALEGFRRSLRRGVEVLRSFGIEARITTSYHGGKEYITVEAPTDY